LRVIALVQNLYTTTSVQHTQYKTVKYSGTMSWNQSQEHELKAGYASGFYKIMDCISTFTPIYETFN